MSITIRYSKTSISLKPYSLNLQFQMKLQPLLRSAQKTPLYMFPISPRDWLHQWNLPTHSFHHKVEIMVMVHLFWTGYMKKWHHFQSGPRILSNANSHDKQEMKMTSWLNYTRSSQSIMSVPRLQTGA